MAASVSQSGGAAGRGVFYGWWMTAVSFLFMMLIVGFALYGLPLFYPDWVNQFGWSRAQVTFGNTLAKIIVGPLFGFLAGWIIDRRGPRGVMLAGAVFAASALAGFSLLGASLAMLYAFFFLNALGYLCAGPLPNQVLLSHWFRRLRGRVMGIAYVGIGVGGMLVPWVVFFLNRHFHGDWRMTLRVLSVLFAVVMGLLLLVIRRRPADLGLCPDGDAEPGERAASAARPAVRLRDVVRTPAFWLLAAGSVLSIGAIGGVMQNLPLYLKDVVAEADFDLTKTRIMSLVLFSSIAGRLAMGWLADRFTKKYVMLLTYLIVAGAIPLLILSREYLGLLYVFAVCFGFGLGADYMLIPLMAGECFGLAALSRVLGIIITTDSVGEALMPFLTARLRDTTGSYAWGFCVLTGLALLGAVCIMSIRYHRGIPVSRLRLEAEGRLAG